MAKVSLFLLTKADHYLDRDLGIPVLVGRAMSGYL